jgi:hypothetical protein
MMTFVYTRNIEGKVKNSTCITKMQFARFKRLFIFQQSLFIHIFSAVCCLLLSHSSKAAAKTFNVVAGNWEVGSNWSPSGIPSAGDTISIPSGVTCSITSAATGAFTFSRLWVYGTLNAIGTSMILPSISADTIFGSGRVVVSEADPIPSGKVWLPTVVFNSGTIIQNIPHGTYDSLALNAQRTKRFIGRIKVDGFSIYNTMTNAEKFITDGSCIQFIGAGNNTVPSGSTTQLNTLVYDSLIIGGGGEKTLVNGSFYIRKYLNVNAGTTFTIGNAMVLKDSSASAITVEGSGTVKLTTSAAASIPSDRTWTPTIWYAYTGGSQTILSGVYANLNGTGAGRTLSSTGEVVITGQFTPGAGTYNPGTSVFRYSGSDTQTVAAIQYYSLTLENGHKRFSTSGTIRIQGIFTPGTVTATTAVSKIDFNGALQNIPAFTYGSIITSGGNAKSASGNIVITDTLKVTITFDMLTYLLSGSFVCDPAGTGTFRTGNVSSMPVPAGKIWPGTFRYNSVTGTQTIVSGDYFVLDLNVASNRIFSSADTIKVRSSMSPGSGTFTTTGSTIAYTGANQTAIVLYNYNNLVIGGTGTKTAEGNLTVNGELNVTSILDMTTFTLGGTLTSITGNGTIRTDNTSATPFPAAHTWNPSIKFAAAGSQRIVAGNYTNLDLTGGNRVLSPSDTIGISGIWTLGAGTHTITGSSVNFNGGNQTIPAFTFNNLVISGTGIKTIAGSITVNNLLSVRSTLNLVIYTLSGITTQTGTGWIQTQITTTGGVPVPSRGWTCGIELNGNVDQHIPSGGPFGKLKLSGSGIKTANANLSVTDSLLVYTQLELGTYVLSTSGSLKTIGTSIIRTANTSPTPIPAGISWVPKMQYYAPSGTQTIVGGSYSRLQLSGSVSGISKQMSGNVTVSDSFRLDAFSVLQVQSHTLTVNGYFSYEDPANNTIITNETSNIVVGGSTVDHAGIFNQDGYRSVGNFTLSRPGGSVSLGNGKMGVHGTLNVQNGILHTNDNLVLVSNSSGTANTGPLLAGADITGVVAVQRYIPPVTRRWRFISSPVSGSTLTTLQNSMYVTGTGNAANGFDSTLSSIASVFSYNETVTTGDYNTGWVAASNINNSVTTGTGYRVFIRGDRSDPGRLNGTVTTQNEVTINWQGPLNKGNISMPVTFTSSGNASNDGWNFVGNPYASPYNWNAFYDAGTNFTNLSSIVYVLDASCYCYKSYNASSNAGTLTNGIIPAGAGFWVKATAASPTLTLTEQFKTSTSPINTIFKTTSEETFTIRLIADSISYDEVLIKYLDGSQRTKDSFDIQKLAASVINIGTYGSDNEPLSLSSRPPVTTNDTIRLKVQSGTSGTFTMQFMNSTVQDQVYLFDTYTSQVINLKTTNQYTFTITTTIPSSQGLNRFYIVVSNSTSLPVELLSFTAKKTSAKQVQLNWITGLELNNDRFEIERSADNETFEKLSEINGRGNTTSVSSYQYIDKTPQELNYYRLKQIDKDGKFRYSIVRIVDMREEMNHPALIKLYPNPVVNSITVETENGHLAYRLFNETGAFITSGFTQSRETTIKMAGLKTGIYYLEITDEHNRATIEKIIRQ